MKSSSRKSLLLINSGSWEESRALQKQYVFIFRSKRNFFPLLFSLNLPSGKNESFISKLDFEWWHTISTPASLHGSAPLLLHDSFVCKSSSLSTQSVRMETAVAVIIYWPASQLSEDRKVHWNIYHIHNPLTGLYKGLPRTLWHYLFSFRRLTKKKKNPHVNKIPNTMQQSKRRKQKNGQTGSRQESIQGSNPSLKMVSIEKVNTMAEIRFCIFRVFCQVQHFTAEGIFVCLGI